MLVRYFILLCLLSTFAVAPVSAEVKYSFKNKCADIDPAALASANALTDRIERGAALDVLWECLNKTQAAQSEEAVAQLLLAVKNTGFKKKIPFVLRDPKILRNEEYGRYWEFGAWYVNGRIEFAAMPGCPNARKILERLLRRLK